MKLIQILTFTFYALFITEAYSQEDPYAEDREALRSILRSIETGLNEKNIDIVLENLDDNVVVTYLNAEVSTNPSGVKEYFDKVITGDKPIIKSYSTKANVSSPAVFHGDTAIAYGTADEHYVLSKGLDFNIKTFWSTTLIKKEGQWKIVSLHFSNSLFDNPMIETAKKLNWIYGIVGFILAFIIAFVIFRIRKK